MELRIDFPKLPEGMDLTALRRGLDEVLEDDGWLLTSGQKGECGFVEMELEDEKINPKYGIMAVKAYLQRAKFDPKTTIELAGTPVGIYE
ncbi:MAG: hypothetical protein VB096_02120 [Pseudoflavonifractor sp.]|nr:hypothetical protein [Pseudoflavonifractor sp.]